MEYELSTFSEGRAGQHDSTRDSSPARSHTSGSRLRHSEPQEGTTIQELAPLDRGIRAWTFCACGFVVEMMVWGFLFSYGIFQDYYTHHPPFNSSSQVAIAAVGTVGLGIQYGEVLFLSVLFRRYPDYMRTAMWCALVLYFLCLLGSSFATKVWQLILLQGVGLGFSGGFMYLPVMILLPQWFSQRRGLAGGIIFAGTGVGGFVFPFLLNALLNNVGLRWTLRIWAIMTCVSTGIAFYGVRPRVPMAKFQPGQRRPLAPRMEYFKSPLFLSFSFTCLIQGLSYFPVSLYIATFTQTVSTPLTATVALSLFNSAGVVGQVILGYLTDRFAYPWVMLLSSVGSALAAFFLWGFASGPALIYPFAVIFGALSGGFSSVWPNAAVDCAGRQPENADITYAGTAMFKGVSAVIGPIVSGILLEAGRSSTLGHGYGVAGYGAVEIFVGSCALATGLGSIVVAAARQRLAST
ncbi:MFS general substrate transporter [Trametes coccinea BRFM310]|uniref:MFS general substrate transporter n=1 Tax=Trametes coccinea (strain BRFM310) TaxID=1353009 RepID=A0A1Y2J3U8_TRAC3|nr:MFS general substrate transporter [Trametes coccinea BRFM310]